MKASRLRSVTRCVLLSVLVILSSCEADSDNGPIGEDDLSEATVLFQFSYANWAWGYQNRGWFLDSNGQIKTYRINDPNDWKSANNEGYISREDLMANYSKVNESVAYISKVVLDQKELLIKETINGEISRSTNSGADMGAWIYYCYYWDEELKMYKQQLLDQTGDWRQHNTELEAVALTTWLKSISPD